MNSIACICDLGFRTRPFKSSNCCIKQGIQGILETPIIKKSLSYSIFSFHMDTDREELQIKVVFFKFIPRFNQRLEE